MSSRVGSMPVVEMIDAYSNVQQCNNAVEGAIGAVDNSYYIPSHIIFTSIFESPVKKQRTSM